MSQKGIVLNHLREHKTITSWEAIQKYHITRLAAVISLLRADGNDIETIPQRDKKRGNNYALYVLRKENTNV